MAEVSNSKLFHASTGIHAKDACVVVVRTEWNSEIVDELEKGCLKVLRQHGVQNIVVLEVPGAVEISFAIKKYWDAHRYRDGKPHVFVALGCVIRGGTPHFDYVCQSVTNGITRLNLKLPVPTIFGVLTLDNRQQAEERIGGVHGHKGEEAGMTALKMIAFSKSVSSRPNTPGT